MHNFSKCNLCNKVCNRWVNRRVGSNWKERVQTSVNRFLKKCYFKYKIRVEWYLNNGIPNSSCTGIGLEKPNKKATLSKEFKYKLHIHVHTTLLQLYIIPFFPLISFIFLSLQNISCVLHVSHPRRAGI